MGRAFLACWCGIAAYCLLSVVAGPAGLVAYRGLESRVALMRQNLDDLAMENEALAADLESLRADPARAMREARALGYLASGEKALVLGGTGSLGSAPGPQATGLSGAKPSEIVRYEAVSPMDDATIKALALLAALAAFALGLAHDLRQRYRAQEPRAKVLSGT